MFWDKWIPKKYLVKSEICGVEACFTEEGITYHYTYLKNKGKTLDVLQTGTLQDKPELPKQITKNKVPLVVVINGKGVILKKIGLSENAEQGFDELVKQNLPAINPADFFIQIYRQNNLTAFIALCRKDQVHRVVDYLKGFEIADLLIGAPAVIGLSPLWSNFNSLQTSQHVVELTNGAVDVISNQTPGKEPIKIEDILLAPQYTLGFAGGLSYLLQSKVAETNAEELVAFSIKHAEKSKLRFLTVLIVGLAFMLAAINVFFYTSYFDKNNKLETELGVYQGKYEQINQLLNDYQKKKDLIENAGILNKNKLSEYADKIGGTIPDEVTLTEMYFNPKQEDDLSEDSLVVFKNKQLVMKGNCNKSLIINEWVNVLKLQKFVKDVSLEKFAYNNEGILPNFEIRIVTE